MRRTVILSLAFTLALGAHAAAQTCVGMPAFSSGHMQVAGGGQFADGSSSFGGTFGYGTPKSFYGKAGIGTTSYDGLDGSSFDFNVGGGYQVPLHTKPTAELCPIASLSLGSGPNDVLGSGVDLSTRTFAFGPGGRRPRDQPAASLPAERVLPVRQHPRDGGRRHQLGVGLPELRAADAGHRVRVQLALQPEPEHQPARSGWTAVDTSFGLMGAMNFGR